MIVCKENERLYPSAFEYGAARVLSRLAEIVTTHGGKVKPLKTAVISNRNNNDCPVVTVTNTSYIEFVYSGNHYYFEVNSNPFFPFYYHKTPVVDGMHKMNVYSDELSKEWLIDPVFRGIATETEIDRAALALFTLLIKAPISRAYGESKRRRVYNRYGAGYHYETVPVAARYEKIDF